MSDHDGGIEWLLKDIREFVEGGGRIVFRTSEQWDELQRTRIEPGADPRAECAPFDWEMARFQLEQRPRAIAEVRDKDGKLRCIVMDNPRNRVERVVPEDVARWRDPKHREALTKRAREYAASWKPRKNHG